jgi:hypothetical protein
MVEILEVDEFETGCFRQALVECFSEILVFEEERDFLEKPVDVVGRRVGIDRRNAGVEQIGEDVGRFVPFGPFQRKVGIPQSCEVENRGDLYPGVFVVDHDFR